MTETDDEGNAVWRKADKPNGGVAQLGERLPCKQEVSGSIPLISTIFLLISKDPYRSHEIEPISQAAQDAYRRMAESKQVRGGL